ncbi:hypothetical protein EO98_06855 [Methanosarcina sp. 2.H.T.1A.6]|nr:hypothetical protein EO94_08480 [Methanosarcina sp. 2.H.T.1A.3]KKG20217.1 hypothetical protein EO98_06855 [Methanosarcina sp. 2.H.T.1A.6]KKG25842.1 hypothetical protein EO97_13200 [Methanosarcina sp. 2.H.T.1A.15]KKG26675.1 hypothetical protein EO96_03420 [Methanosarcina sp. 2.H.T.1A.8]
MARLLFAAYQLKKSSESPVSPGSNLRSWNLFRRREIFRTYILFLVSPFRFLHNRREKAEYHFLRAGFSRNNFYFLAVGGCSELSRSCLR